MACSGSNKRIKGTPPTDKVRICNSLGVAGAGGSREESRAAVAAPNASRIPRTSCVPNSETDWPSSDARMSS